MRFNESEIRDCGHPRDNVTYVVDRDGDGMFDKEDFEYLRKAMNTGKPFDESVKSVHLCFDCKEALPSARRKRGEAAESMRLAKEAHHEEMEELRGRVESGETLLFCPECEHIMDEGEEVQVRHCPHCEANFNGTDNGRNCEECNRPFSSLVVERGCPECLSEGEDEVEELTVEKIEKLIV